MVSPMKNMLFTVLHIVLMSPVWWGHHDTLITLHGFNILADAPMCALWKLTYVPRNRSTLEPMQAQINPWSQVPIDPWAQTHIDPWAQSQINPGAKWAQVQIDPWAQVMMIHESRLWLAFEPCNTSIYIKCIGIGEWLSLFLIIL